MLGQRKVRPRPLVVTVAASCGIVLGAFFTVFAGSGQTGSTPPAAGRGSEAPQMPPGQGRGAAPGQPAGAARGGPGGFFGTPVNGPDGEVWGFSDTAFNPNSRWRIHDANRPQPPVVTPGETVSIPPPSDATVLFDGKDLSQWVSRGQNGVEAPATWVVRDGYFEAAGGNLSTRDSFGDVQLHLEFAIPADVTGSSQGRGNGGVTFMRQYEIQILDSYNNRTYADGMMASIYGEWPPLVNVARKPGEWQSVDIVFEAPRFSGKVSPGYFTILWNGVMVHNRTQLLGATTAVLTPHAYTAHEAELPLSLQGRARVRYRNVWIRRLTPYDHGAKPQ
jgi:Domain of Unknown Function (DUF1080)